MDTNQLLLIKVYAGHLKVTFYSSAGEDRLETIHLSKQTQKSQSDYNEDVNAQSLIQLNLLAARLDMDFRFDNFNQNDREGEEHVFSLLNSFIAKSQF